MKQILNPCKPRHPFAMAAHRCKGGAHRRSASGLRQRAARELRAELANAKAERDKIAAVKRRQEPALEPSSRAPEEIEADLEALPKAVAALEVELAEAPKLIELARRKHAEAFKAVVTWGRA